MPGTTQHKLTDGPARVSQAALFGGTTTIIDFALVDGGNTVQQAIERRQQEWAGDCYGDYAFHTMLLGKLAPEMLDAARRGGRRPAIRASRCSPPTSPRRARAAWSQFGDIWEVLKVLAKAGGIAAIHAEDNDIVMHMYEKLIREDRTGFENMAEVHNTLSEDLSFNRVIRLAANIEGAALYMMHTSAATGVRAIAAARANGVPIYGETLHQYLMYIGRGLQTAERPDLPHLPVAQIPPRTRRRCGRRPITARSRPSPPTRSAARCESSCRAGASTTPPAAMPGSSRGVSLIYTETVEKRGYGLDDFVGLVSTNAAKIMGLYPRKGALAVGSDADIVLLDTRQRHIVRAAEMHEADYSPWEGRDLAAWPSLTMLRGKIVVEGGALNGALNDGQFLPRKVPDDIRSRPGV